MISSVELRRVPVFSDLPDCQIEWFLSHVQEISVKSGESFVRQGDPADWMFIFLEGLFQWRGEFGGDTVSLPAQAGDVSGAFPFSRMKRFTVTGRALTDGRLARFPSASFSELVQKLPELTTRLVAMMSERIREGTRIEQLRDRSVSLGKLSAGLAHELNNPATAAKRAASQIRDALAKVQSANSELWRQPITELDKSRIEEAEASLVQSGTPRLDGLALGDLEDQIASILGSYGHADPWELSAGLARCNMHPDRLTILLKHLDSTTARPALARIAATAELSILLNTIEDSTVRIAKLVSTVKEYTYMDQSPAQYVDVARSLESTLGTLAHRLRSNIDVKRAYGPAPVIVSAVGTELNQIWTNLIDNAIDAMRGGGELRLQICKEDDCVVVEIGDTGCGIPPEIKPCIFDPFFTTKGVGEGMGLGLSTVQTIVRKLGGNIVIASQPGNTCFQVRLPRIDQSELGKEFS